MKEVVLKECLELKTTSKNTLIYVFLCEKGSRRPHER